MNFGSLRLENAVVHEFNFVTSLTVLLLTFDLMLHHLVSLLPEEQGVGDDSIGGYVNHFESLFGSSRLK